MEAFVVALLLLMWMLVKAGRDLALSPRLVVAAPLRLALAVLVGAAGLGLVAVLAWRVLPGSALSQGWTREMLLGAQQWSAGLALLLALEGLRQVWSALWAKR